MSGPSGSPSVDVLAADSVDSSLISLPHGALHLWPMPLGTDAGRDWEGAAEAVLSVEEKVRCQRYRRAEDRELFARAHIAVREILSRYTALDPAAWIFWPNRYGRPEIANPEALTGLRFNLSHTRGADPADGLDVDRGALAVVVHRVFDAGVDIETLNRVSDLEQMARTCFSAVEQDLLLAQPPGDRQLWFTRTWTLKESFIKAKGMGLALPLKAFSFDPTDPANIGFACAPEVDSDAAQWTFTLQQLSASRVVATAAKRGDRPD